MANKKLKAFADSKTGPQKHFLIFEDGSEEETTDSIVSGFWNHWITSGNSKRNDTKERNVFEYIEPIKVKDK